MNSRFQGDPLITISENGASLTFKGGQPEMTNGFENVVNMQLFTKDTWFGNKILPTENDKIGSDFIDVTSQQITLTTLNDAEKSADRALASEAFGSVESSVSNPSGQRLNVAIKITPPGQDIQELTAERGGLNWIAQANN